MTYFLAQSKNASKKAPLGINQTINNTVKDPKEENSTNSSKSGLQIRLQYDYKDGEHFPVFPCIYLNLTSTHKVLHMSSSNDRCTVNQTQVRVVLDVFCQIILRKFLVF